MTCPIGKGRISSLLIEFPLLLRHQILNEYAMNAKKILCMVVALAMAVPVFGRKIHWNGDWRPQKSLVNIPIEGNIDDETCELTLQFLSDLGPVQIVITDDSGNPIYQESVEAEVGQMVSISLNELSAQGQMVSVIDGNNVVYGFIN